MEMNLVYNLRENHPLKKESSPIDIDADWDTIDTIDSLQKTLEKIGFNVNTISCDHQIVQKLSSSNCLVFSICEMTGGSYRESLIPSLCEVLKLPYVFSTPDVMLKTLDKNICNFLVKQAGQNVPGWILVSGSQDMRFLKNLDNYPYIVKPGFEGSGMGINDLSVVYQYTDLRNQVMYTDTQYQQPVLIQEYIEGVELTVGVLGEGKDIEILTPIQIDMPFSKVYGYKQKENSHTQAIYSTISDNFINRKAIEASKIIYRSLGCRDAARIDFRFNAKNKKLYFIEINPLPHLHPDIGDFCRSAYAFGYSYHELINKICSSSLQRQR
jgi:D-alanine-D-alanine ligase